MIKSMTGYGCSKITEDGISVSVEIRSVNNRFLDTSIRIPRSFLFLEDAIKNTVKEHISRGKVDLFVTIDSSALDTVDVRVNTRLAEAYSKAIREISESCAVPFDLTASALGRIPDVISLEKEQTGNEIIEPIISNALELALQDFDMMRAVEGEKLKKDILDRVSSIEDYVSRIEQVAPETVSAYRARLLQKMEEVLQTKGIDENRIIAEAAVFADHIAVDEETVRLRSHVAQMKGFLEQGSPIGKKMDFLIQEFNREANTIGSKCQNSNISYMVVDLKSEIEKIREQVQNIE